MRVLVAPCFEPPLTAPDERWNLQHGTHRRAYPGSRLADVVETPSQVPDRFSAISDSLPPSEPMRWSAVDLAAAIAARCRIGPKVI
jgi:hypothetical protein